ncbi:MAG: autoinducer synthase [Rhodobacteraceae bacterium]|nr:autoinducer synthase [Paracoccaceae bacterium]
MLRYLHANELHEFPLLQDTMFKDRKDQFCDRLGWDLKVDDQGWERDEYDAENPLYVIWERQDGSHGGSARFLPTTGRTMVNDHFLDLTDGVAFQSPLIWECTRFCLAPGADGRVAAGLMLGGSELMRAYSISHFVGVFDARMIRVYRLIGASPAVLGSRGLGRDKISVGLWEYDASGRDRLLRKAGLSSELSNHWINRSFGADNQLKLTG